VRGHIFRRCKVLVGQLPVDEQDRLNHWQKVYSERGEAGVSWFEGRPEVSLELIARVGGTAASSLVDIGGGAARLVDALLAAGWRSVAVLDVSSLALEAAKKRLGAMAGEVDWVVADVTAWRPVRSFDIWHDRAAFHFLVDPADRAAYVERLAMALKPGGHAIIATFGPDGPARCSGLPVVRYDPQTLVATLGPAFELVDSRRHVHATPFGTAQAFQFSVIRHGERV